MKKTCLALATLLLPLTAFAYPSELEKQLNGAEVAAEIQDIDTNIGGLILYNYGQMDAKCKARFRNGPEAPRTRSAELKAGERTLLTIRFARNIIKLRVDLTCEQSGA
ncbi:3-phosphoglycerate kinase [Pseudomonas sp. BMS12]|uniref:3-phosphoglycerate kinase n=1 Tax=Pseudomonas sp. BMS12 TaxID=1796033 RepID=UPI00083A80B6|nr:3-phosphoglycerate kinase [Pseudomonas sp. BMS12]